jgi:two-component system, OmpR family, KDP operon response regulator KdpE
MHKVLIIDDEPQIRRMLRVILEGAGYRVFDAATGHDGLTEAATRLPDVVLLDLGLPDGPGLDVLRHLREWAAMPVLILSVHDAADDKVAALDAGADDYVTKPFEPVELLARLRVLLRRALPPDEPVISCGSLRMDLAAQRVWVGAQPLDLTGTEYAVLRLLARHAGKIVTHRALLSAVWGPAAAGQAQYLRVYVSHLRRKLAEAGGDSDLIRTETGVGYRMEFP